MAMETGDTAVARNSLERVGSYPVIASTLDQVKTIYERCKDANNLLKYSLETAETGAKLLSDKASPVVHKLPIATVNNMALNQLEKLEEKYPIVTKPTEEVLEETKKLYEATLKPSVDKVQAVGQYATERYTGAKEYATGKAIDVAEYGMVKVYDLTAYGTEKVTQIKDAGTEKLNTFLQTPQGKAVVHKLDQAIDYAESCVDKYLPENETEAESKEKPRTRLYNRVMKEMKNLQLRSQETLQNLHFTVNLIEYARTNMDTATTKLTETMQAVQEKTMYYVDEIRKEPEDDIGDESSKTLERKAIRMARHLTHNLREGLYTINESFVPITIFEKLEEARQFTSDLMWSMMKATNIEELPEFALAKAKDQIFRIQDVLIRIGDLITPYLDKNDMEEMGEMGEEIPEPTDEESSEPMVEESSELNAQLQEECQNGENVSEL